MPVTGFYEHRAIKGWKKKVPYFIRLTGKSTFFIAGLYSVSDLADLETGEVEKRWTFGIITRDANPVMAQIHNDGDNRSRMPLILSHELARRWLQDDLSEEAYREILSFEAPAEQMDYWPVFTIRSPKSRPDDKPKFEYWEWEKLPALGEMNPD